MADMNQNKAEQYRQERKDRLAKSAKKNAKSMEKSIAVRSVIKKVIAIVLVAVIALGAAYGILDYAGVVNKAVQVGYVGNENISFSEYIYYYNRAFNTLYQNEQYYQYYGYSYTGYDTTKAPQDQTEDYKDAATGETMKWTEYLHDQAVDMAQMYLAFYQEAKKLNLELTEADEAAIDKSIEELREQAAQTGTQSASGGTIKGYSLNSFLRLQYGNGINESFLRKQMKIETLAQKFHDTKHDEFSAGYTAEEVKAVFDKDPDLYTFVDIRFYQFSNEELTKGENETDDELKARQEKSDKETKANAQAMYDAITDEKSFVAQATKYNKTENYDADSATLIKSASKTQIGDGQNLESINADLATWAFGDDVKAGSKKLISDDKAGTYIVALMVNPQHDVKTVDVRHILFATTNNETGEALSDEEIKQAETDAKKALADWEAGDKTEDSFAQYATDLTDDTGSASTGGLYENVVPGQMVAEFDTWIFDEARKAGDAEIVETEFGYHVIYFVDAHDSFSDVKIRSDLATEDVNTLAEDLLEGDTYVVGVGPRRTNYLEEKMLKRIAKTIASNNQNTASYQ
ncbi:MAG: peptidyl-prolyl cis-trans isomerase [Clostridia bacterium]|nr:peptidyl-prolyl cis-trans isomerase [Clostridia bacterium]